jgi:hypothetical protein
MHVEDSPGMGPVALARNMVACTVTLPSTRSRTEAEDGNIVVVLVMFSVPRLCTAEKRQCPHTKDINDGLAPDNPTGIASNHPLHHRPG